MGTNRAVREKATGIVLLFKIRSPERKKLSATNLLAKKTLWSDDVLEHVTSHVHVDCTKWVVEEVDIGVLIHSSSQTYSQLLAAA